MGFSRLTIGGILMTDLEMFPDRYIPLAFRSEGKVMSRGAEPGGTGV